MAKINIFKSWRPTSGSLIHAGVYRIPSDLPQDLADKALADGAGAMLPDDPPKQKTKPVLGLKKTPAPENKLQPAAPENKRTDASLGG